VTLPLTVDGAFGISAVVLSASQVTAHATAMVPPDLPYLKGHFPRFAVVPGMAIVDLVHRVAVALDVVRPPIDELVLATYTAPLMPGETLTIDCSLDSDLRELDARGSVNGRELCHIVLRFQETVS
jgi:3-hydroxymyristoyl/3-hydroxydecanoyl-(acyl carrier protein) dehydratase